MANLKITMLKLKRIIQMRLAGKSMDEISSSLRMSKTTVKKYLDLVEGSGKLMTELRHMDNKALAALLQPGSQPAVEDIRKSELDPLLDVYLSELNKPYKTVQLVWEHYIRDHPAGYRYTQFKKYLLEHKKRRSLSYTNVYQPGREMQVDYAGDPLYLYDKASGTYVKLSVLCCIMPRCNRYHLGAMRTWPLSMKIFIVLLGCYSCSIDSKYKGSEYYGYSTNVIDSPK